MSNFEKIRSMSLDQFAEWLDKNIQFDGSLWIDWFDKNYCSNCEPIMCHYEETPEHEFPCAYCELEDCCKLLELSYVPNNYDIIKMWLNREE